MPGVPCGHSVSLFYFFKSYFYIYWLSSIKCSLGAPYWFGLFLEVIQYDTSVGFCAILPSQEKRRNDTILT